MNDPCDDRRPRPTTRILWIVVELTLVALILGLLALFLLPAWMTATE
jgi:hypothetical protein